MPKSKLVSSKQEELLEAWQASVSKDNNGNFKAKDEELTALFEKLKEYEDEMGFEEMLKQDLAAAQEFMTQNGAQLDEEQKKAAEIALLKLQYMVMLIDITDNIAEANMSHDEATAKIANALMLDDIIADAEAQYGEETAVAAYEKAMAEGIPFPEALQKLVEEQGLSQLTPGPQREEPNEDDIPPARIGVAEAIKQNSMK